MEMFQNLKSIEAYLDILYKTTKIVGSDDYPICRVCHNCKRLSEMFNGTRLRQAMLYRTMGTREDEATIV